jgi:phosphatidylserine decarboxylase
MDPFVVASLGRKTFRTRVIRHNLNPIFDEKMVFQVMRHEQQYSLSLSIVDRDKLSGNDFIGKADFPLSTIILAAPEPDPETGLYPHREPPEPFVLLAPTKSRFRLPLSRSSSATSLNKLSRPAPVSRPSQSLATTPTTESPTSPTSDPNSLAVVASHGSENGDAESSPSDDPDLKSYEIPLVTRNKEKKEDLPQSRLYIKAKYMPYAALRQQFWRAMLKQYDTDESARISKVELSTMLDTLGSTLKESTIDSFFERFSKDTVCSDLTFDQAVICLEDQLHQTQKKKSWGIAIKEVASNVQSAAASLTSPEIYESMGISIRTTPATKNEDNVNTETPGIGESGTVTPDERADLLGKDDLTDERGEEHVIEIRECPICHQPRLNKRSDKDIITHVATCASQDWRQVNNIVMAGFVTSSQAQRKWYSKVITKISYGGYKLGANSANILVQDRITGQINEERMSVYVRLGIRLLYKGLRGKDMETKRSMPDCMHILDCANHIQFGNS